MMREPGEQLGMMVIDMKTFLNPLRAIGDIKLKDEFAASR